MDIYKKSKRIVIKFGTNTLTREDGSLSFVSLYSFIELISEMRSHGKEVIIVSSGSVALGRNKLGIKEETQSIPVKQACAAIGQSHLMSIYEEGFSRFGAKTAQVLLTEEDFTNRQKYLNLSNTLKTLLEMNIIPVINENDTVSACEIQEYEEENKIICFGDNDKLSALVMSKLDADLLLILSDVDGLYNADPRKNKNAELISEISNIDESITSLGFSSSANGRGGMKTKIEAAKIATASGGSAVILNGKDADALQKFINGQNPGTVFLPKESLPSKQRWIAFANTIHGAVIVNEGAEKAIREMNASLQPFGITQLKNNFNKGDVVSVCSSDLKEIARGIVNYSSNDISLFKDLNPNNHNKGSEEKNFLTVINRENMVLI